MPAVPPGWPSRSLLANRKNEAFQPLLRTIKDPVVRLLAALYGWVSELALDVALERYRRPALE